VRFDLVTIFPRLCDGPLGEGIVRRAIDRGLVDVRVHDLRDYTTDRHRSVDDVSYGGGPGMVFKPEPMFRAVKHVKALDLRPAPVVLLTPQGSRLTQGAVHRLATHERLILVCGHYEGFDERIRTLADLELSIGDYVLTGGELPALVVIDAVTRLLPGALGAEDGTREESFSVAEGLLEYPQYTRPREFRGLAVPEVLVSGDHGVIAKWRADQAEARTRQRRSDLLEDREQG